MKKLFGQFPGGNHIDKAEIKNILDVLKSKSPYRYSGINLKNYCDRFEYKMAKYTDKKYCLAVNSGTAALHCAIHAIGIKKNDEIIIPAYGWSSDLMSIIASNAKPVIAPINSDLNLDINKIKKIITKKTKAIIIIHMRGYPCNFLKIKKFLNKKKIFIIEDCSQCFGGTLNKKRIGHYGDISTMSLQYNKIITSGEGGALMTNSKKFYENSLRFHNLGIIRKIGNNSRKTNDPVGVNIIKSIGLNYRMSEISAAIALAQLNKIKLIMKKCKKNWKVVRSILLKLQDKGYLSLKKIDKNSETNYAFIGYVRNKNITHNKFLKILKKSNIKSEHSDLKDSHHFLVWKTFLLKNNYVFKDFSNYKNLNNFDQGYFSEISSL
tara:strand:+ start:2108 stop:3244 length:1137 start_codon:yes stop_codon:yes gene_type:complete